MTDNSSINISQRYYITHNSDIHQRNIITKKRKNNNAEKDTIKKSSAYITDLMTDIDVI